MALVSPSPEFSSSVRRRETPGRIIFRNFHNLPIPSGTKRPGCVRVSSSVRDLEEPRVLNLGIDTVWNRSFSAPVKPSGAVSTTKQSKEEEEKRNYYINTGYAIRTLREEFPALFYKELSFDIYRDDIVFKDPLNTFVGIENYKSIFWALRFHGRLFFRALWIDIVSLWQPVDNMIMVRWTVHGIPRVPWESRGQFDGTSEYKLDKSGKIYEHRVHNIAFKGPPKFQVLSVGDLIQSIGCPSTPKPTYFETSSHCIFDFVPELKFSGIRNYLPSILTGGIKDDEKPSS